MISIDIIYRYFLCILQIIIIFNAFIFSYRDHNLTALHDFIVTTFDGLPDGEPTDSTYFTTYFPELTLPKTTCLLFNQSVGAVVMKNWDPLVFFPAFAIERTNG